MAFTNWPDGKVKEHFDPMAGEYLSFDEGGNLTEQRPLTQTEWDTYGVDARNASDLRTKVALQVPDLLVMMTDLQARLDIPKADLTNTELRRTIRDVRQLARDVIQLARLVGNVLDSTDSGTP